MKSKIIKIFLFIILFIFFLNINSFFNTKNQNINNSIFSIYNENIINLDTKNNNEFQTENYKNILNTHKIWNWFFINNSWEFLTNLHLFNNNSSKYYIKINDKKYDFEIIKKYENKDLILWKIINYENKNNFLKIQSVNKVALAPWNWNKNLAPWEKIFTYKNNKKIEWKIIWINKEIKEFWLKNLIETDLKLFPWDSWSPLFNSYWKIIWINTIINEKTNTSFAQIIE